MAGLAGSQMGRLPYALATAILCPMSALIGGIGVLEQARVAQHIRRAEAYAATRRTRLPPMQRLARKLLLRELAFYRARGRFPKNRESAAPTPHFVDAEGSRCAVAHLLEASGEGALVRRIAHERNHARVHELADEARLVAWLDVAGLSLEEAARIQPSYCYHRGGCVCDNQSGYFEATVTTKASSETQLARVDAIHGAPSQTTVRVADTVRVSFLPELDVGAQVVLSGPTVPDKDGNPVFRGKTFPLDCHEGTPVLSKEQYLQAVMADDCKATLDTFGDWTPPCGNAFGCRAVGQGSPTTLGIVLSLLGLAIGRRMRRAVR